MRDERVSVAVPLAAVLLLSAGCARSAGLRQPSASATTPAVGQSALPGPSATRITVGVRPSPTHAAPTPAPQAPGQPGNAWSYKPAISADGRYVAFESAASNLVPGDSAGFTDVFVHDRETGRTERISVAPDGTEANESSYQPAISADGRFVAFFSWASNLVPGDDNARTADVFLRDRRTGETVRVSAGVVRRGGSSAYPSLSADGRFVAFVSDGYLWPQATGGILHDPGSYAFLYDREARTLSHVCLTGGQGSGDALPSDGGVFLAMLSPDGRRLALQCLATARQAHETSEHWQGSQVFLRDLETGSVALVSAAADGQPGDNRCRSPSVSRDGRWVAFISLASNLAPGARPGWYGVFLRDCTTGKTVRVADHTDIHYHNDAEPLGVSLSWDGRWLAFSSDADSLVPGDTDGKRDVFVYDRETGRVELVSVAADGGNATGYWPSISADGRYVAFASDAGNLVPGVATQVPQVYVHDRETGSTELVSCSSR